jgi:DNA-directed RNA polymerase subunit RPC12/RpoP
MDEIISQTYSKNYILDLDKENKNKKELIVKIPFTLRVVRCEFCGSKILLQNKSRHYRTRKHLDGMYISTEMFEMS